MKYLVNRETKEHKIYEGGPYPELCDIVEADDEGWIKWEGGDCPLPDDASYTTKSRGWHEGFVLGYMDEPQTNSWGPDGDIIAYRPILPAESKPTLEETWHAIKRDSKVDVFTRLSAAVAAADSIPALIAEINAMLPDGYEVREKAKAEQPAEDMSDWRNWREGDFITYHGKPFAWWTPDKPYKIVNVGGKFVVIANDGDQYEIDGFKLASGCHFKFHSRPVTK